MVLTLMSPAVFCEISQESWEPRYTYLQGVNFCQIIIEPLGLNFISVSL